MQRIAAVVIIASEAGLDRWTGCKMFSNHSDQKLESGFNVSCVWYFQELACWVGTDSLRKYLYKLVHGQLRDSFKKISFWLDGSLVISGRKKYFL
ncbi:MAG: hypothetical protein HGA59_08625 [Chlorobiaceae bacterium]|nr:hypothetical protein [Chlorobiaceae bacterium]NTV17459.1 hypothetical protein [Chlorobiaceae bacterium]